VHCPAVISRELLPDADDAPTEPLYQMAAIDAKTEITRWVYNPGVYRRECLSVWDSFTEAWPRRVRLVLGARLSASPTLNPNPQT